VAPKIILEHCLDDLSQGRVGISVMHYIRFIDFAFQSHPNDAFFPVKHHKSLVLATAEFFQSGENGELLAIGRAIIRAKQPAITALIAKTIDMYDLFHPYAGNAYGNIGSIRANIHAVFTQ